MRGLGLQFHYDSPAGMTEERNVNVKVVAVPSWVGGPEFEKSHRTESAARAGEALTMAIG